MAQIKIKQIKSRIGAPAVVKEDTPSILGMVERVHHLVEVTKA